VTRQTNQDWDEGRAPFAEDSLSDGGVGSGARLVPGHSGRDWAAEIGNGVIRMKEETQQSHENNGKHGGGVFSSEKNWACGAKKASKQPCAREKPTPDWENVLQPVAREENHEKGLRWSWARNQMGNPD
jgi:hypothetical protein